MYVLRYIGVMSHKLPNKVNDIDGDNFIFILIKQL